MSNLPAQSTEEEINQFEQAPEEIPVAEEQNKENE